MVWCRNSCCHLNPGACQLADDADDARRPEFPFIGHPRVRWADPPFGRSCLCLTRPELPSTVTSWPSDNNVVASSHTKDGGNTKLSGQDPGM
jgi:hypothetical protein